MSWRLLSLRDVARAETTSVKTQDLRSSDVYVGLENIGHSGAFVDLGKTDALTLKSNKYRFGSEHVLFGKLRPYLEKVARPDFEGVCSTDILPIRASDQLNRDFLYWWLRSPTVIARATEMSTGATLPRISPKVLQEFEIPLPTLEDQARIAALLDEATAAVSALESVYSQTASKLTDLRSSALASAMAEHDWPLVYLGELCEVLDSQRKPITKKDRVAGEVPYYGASGVVDWVANHIFDEPLVLLGEDGAKWGSGDRSAFRIEGKSWVNNHAHVLRPSRDRILDGWLVSYLVAADLSDFITGLTVPKLNQGRMREIPVPLPPLEDQTRIVALLDEVSAAADEALELASTRLEAAKALRQSILESAFRGEL